MADRGRKAFPISSAIVYQKHCDHAFKVHRERVTSMGPAIDTSAPADYVHFHYNAKRAMQQAERLYDIERENRILLEKMERYAAYTGSRNLRPWTCRATLNFKAGMVFHQGTGAMQIDHMNQPVNVGTVAGGNRKTTYKRRKELEDLAKENMKIKRAISERRPFYSAQALEHDYLENVSRIDRLSSFRGPQSAAHRPAAVRESLDVAKSMRETKWRPGTAGYQRDLAKSMGRSMQTRQGAISVNIGRTGSGKTRAQSAKPASRVSTGLIYAAEANRSMSRANTMSRCLSSRPFRPPPAIAEGSGSGSSGSEQPVGFLDE